MLLFEVATPLRHCIHEKIRFAKSNVSFPYIDDFFVYLFTRYLITKILLNKIPQTAFLKKINIIKKRSHQSLRYLETRVEIISYKKQEKPVSSKIPFYKFFSFPGSRKLVARGSRSRFTSRGINLAPSRGGTSVGRH